MYATSWDRDLSTLSSHRTLSDSLNRRGLSPASSSYLKFFLHVSSPLALCGTCGPMGLVLPSMVRGFSSSHFSSSICLCFSLMVIWYDIYCLGLSVLALEPCLLHQPNRVLDTMVEARRSECSYLRFVAVVIFVPLGSLSPHSGLRLGRVYLSPPCWIT